MASWLSLQYGFSANKLLDCEWNWLFLAFLLGQCDLRLFASFIQRMIQCSIKPVERIYMAFAIFISF